MIRVYVLLLLILTSLLSPSVRAESECKALIASGNAEYPPYLWRSPDDPEKLVGAIAFMIEDLAREIALPIDLRYSGPWGRVQKEVASGRVDMIAGAFFTQPRTEYMDYIYPEFQGTATAVWFNKEKPFKYTLWSDLKILRGVTVINNSFGQEFDEYSATELNINQVVSLEQGLRMLSAARVDYLIYEENPGKAYANQLNIENVAVHNEPVTRQNLYLTVSRVSACNSDQLKEQLAEALTLFDTQSRMNTYLEKAHQLWASQQTQ
ncbi:substrate-binding periplasmic protein [Oceanospirillum sediminis]|nr:transporter substrate-binding domain-containing protein [Oceanospirillum sediminis]